MSTKEHAGRFWSSFPLSGHCPVMVQYVLITKEVLCVYERSIDKKQNKTKQLGNIITFSLQSHYSLLLFLHFKRKE